MKTFDWGDVISWVVGLYKRRDIFPSIHELEHILYAFQSLHAAHYLGIE